MGLPNIDGSMGPGNSTSVPYISRNLKDLVSIQDVEIMF